MYWDFEVQTDHTIKARGSNKLLINEEKRTCHFGNLAMIEDQRMKVKEGEKLDK